MGRVGRSSRCNSPPLTSPLPSNGTGVPWCQLVPRSSEMRAKLRAWLGAALGVGVGVGVGGGLGLVRVIGRGSGSDRGRLEQSCAPRVARAPGGRRSAARLVRVRVGARLRLS